MIIQLEERELQWLLGTLAQKCTWAEANAIIMKIGVQMQRQAQQSIQPTPNTGGPGTNSHDLPPEPAAG